MNSTKNETLLFNEIVQSTMKSKRAWMKSSALPQMKLNPSFSRRSRISSRSDFIHLNGFIPSVKTDLVENNLNFKQLRLFSGGDGESRPKCFRAFRHAHGHRNSLPDCFYYFVIALFEPRINKYKNTNRP